MKSDPSALRSLQALPVATVFLVAGLGKLSNVAEASNVLRRYRLFPGDWARPLTFALGALEVGLAAAALALPPRLAAALVLVALGGFSAFLATALIRGVRIDCGCLGRGLPSVVSWWTLARNLILAVPAVVLLTADTRWTEEVRVGDLIPALTIASLEACALFLVAAALGLNSLRVDSPSRGRSGGYGGG